MNKTTISALMLAVAVLATGCKKADNDPSTGPAQEAGKAIDNTAANAAQETREATAATAAAADRAGDKIENAADRAGDKIENAADRANQNMKEAGAEVRQETREAAHDVKHGAANATDAAGKSLERTGEKMQEASK
jgi:PBP1b-binding outer membrane lipoprotein LpoB